MRLGLACLAGAALVIVAAWAWLGAPVPMPQSPVSAGEKLYCVSYAPFRGTQTPLDPSTRITAAQIDDDLGRLAKISNCVRTYSTDYGLDQIAGIAQKHGLKVLQGLWLSSDPLKNKDQVASAIALARQYPDTVRAVVVGNEVLLRGEMSGTDLANIMRTVKAAVSQPITYADVWEFWLRNRDVAAVADFITIHILPYWEDFPIPAERSAAHVRSIRQQVVDVFPGKEVIIGEVGWPSAGRMREGALPSPANQAMVIQDVLALAKRDNFKVNVIEAFDAPWKRALEGTVGGHWGLYFDASRSAKFDWGVAVSNHPFWQCQAAGGVLFAILVFAAGFAVREADAPASVWPAVAVNAVAGGILTGWAVENLPLESLGAAGWVRNVAMLVVAIASPLILTVALRRGTPMPALTQVIGPANGRTHDRLARLVGAVMIATLILSILVALGLVFDPRYRDFPFAPLTAAIMPLLVHSISVPRPAGHHGVAELAAAGILAGAIVYIVPDEGLANWQSLWLCAALAGLTITLTRVRDARG